MINRGVKHKLCFVNQASRQYNTLGGIAPTNQYNPYYKSLQKYSNQNLFIGIVQFILSLIKK